ncbi:hypothetical protein RJT34_08366 [Clitoria ternatea]|uniref:Uncharacterized protein n=1 Tax=Clitoria ternatea TaxID=43366 RepID=A0AAN9PVM4_CLITE
MGRRLATRSFVEELRSLSVSWEGTVLVNVEPGSRKKMTGLVASVRIREAHRSRRIWAGGLTRFVAGWEGDEDDEGRMVRMAPGEEYEAGGEVEEGIGDKIRILY